MIKLKINWFIIPYLLLYYIFLVWWLEKYELYLQERENIKIINELFFHFIFFIWLIWVTKIWNNYLFKIGIFILFQLILLFNILNFSDIIANINTAWKHLNLLLFYIYIWWFFVFLFATIYVLFVYKKNKFKK